jgi:predicted HicB family RNase H-like nuclease
MNLLHYKGYYGSIEASPEDNILYGKLQFIQALVNYEGTTVAELKAAFEEAVDDYLTHCKDTGVEPEKPFKGSFNVRVGQERHARVMLYVKQHKLKSLNDFVTQAIDHELERIGA